jgi:hypothetical protein
MDILPVFIIFELLKRTFSILFLCVFGFHLTGLFLVFKVQQYQVRKEIKQQIKLGVPEDELARITVTSDNEHLLDWEHDKEFRYKGTMYDVVKKEVIDTNTVVYHCITDKQETKLFTNLDQQVRKEMETKNKGNDMKDLLNLLSISYSQPVKTTWSIQQKDLNTTFRYTFYYTSPLLEITSPPPETV